MSSIPQPSPAPLPDAETMPQTHEVAAWLDALFGEEVSDVEFADLVDRWVAEGAPGR